MKEVIQQMGPLNSPSPDGMLVLFYQKYWSIVGNDVTDVVFNFLNNGDFIDEVNQIFIVLIPMIRSVQNMSQFRTILLCNVVYKIISKVLANRL